MVIKAWRIGEFVLLPLLLYKLLVELALKGIVWYGPLMVAVFTFLLICICVDHGLEGKIVNYNMSLLF